MLFVQWTSIQFMWELKIAFTVYAEGIEVFISLWSDRRIYTDGALLE